MPEPQLDVQALHSALDTRRRLRKISWRELADEAGISASTLTRLGQGKRPDVDSFAALVSWLGVSSDEFIRKGTESVRRQPDLLTVISTHLRARRELTPQSAKALEEIIRAAYEQLKTRPAR